MRMMPLGRENFVFSFKAYLFRSGNTGYFVRDGAFSDNDGLASLVAAQMKVKYSFDLLKVFCQ